MVPEPGHHGSEEVEAQTFSGETADAARKLHDHVVLFSLVRTHGVDIGEMVTELCAQVHVVVGDKGETVPADAAGGGHHATHDDG